LEITNENVEIGKIRMALAQIGDLSEKKQKLINRWMFD